MPYDFDYAKEVQIDPYNLDIEWTKQAPLVFKYAEALAEAKRELDEAKEALDLLEAQKDLEIREESDKKPTENAIAKMVLADEEVQEASNKVIQCKYNVNLLTAAQSAIDARGRALPDLVKLHLNQYYAEPAADIEARGLLEEHRTRGARERVVINKPTSGKPPKTDGGMQRKK